MPLRWFGAALMMPQWWVNQSLVQQLYSSCTTLSLQSYNALTTDSQRLYNSLTTPVQRSYNSLTAFIQRLFNSCTTPPSGWVLLPGDGEAGVPFIPRPKSCTTERHGRGNFRQLLETIRWCRWVGRVFPECAASEMEPGEDRCLQENSLKL